MPEIEIRMTVNGRKVVRNVVPHLRLIDFLRDVLSLTGNKEGCGAGECGTCSVFVNGRLQKSCLLPVVKAQDAVVVTIEGIDSLGHLSIVQKAFHKAGSSQCGYCIPGMVMAATKTLMKHPHADRVQIKEGLGGNICRCTGYQKIIDAVELARDVANGDKPESALAEEAVTDKFVGVSVRRLDAPSKVSGALRYAADMVMVNMLHMQVLRSPVAYGRIVEIDVSEAKSMPGVEAVLTCEDVPGIDNFGVFYDDQPVMARGVVRYIGEAVAAVVAESPLLARQAVEKIRLEIEPLPAVFDPVEAMKSQAPQLFADRPGNICRHVKIRKGDFDSAVRNADLVVEETYHTNRVEHAYLEPEAGLAYLDADGTIVIQSPSQNITHHRHALARILAMPINKVRMIMSPVGGGFGGKEDMIYQGMLALAAIKTRRPVRYVFTRKESFAVSSKREPAIVHVTTGLRKDGKVIAHKLYLIADGGAYAQSSPGVMNKSAILGAGPYAIDNVWIDTIAVYTNNCPSGAFRSFGAYESEFATEAHFDLCAEKMGMDPLEFRRINAMRDGAITHTRQQIGSVSLLRTIDAAAQAAGWSAGITHRQGHGLPERTDLGGPGTRRPYDPANRLLKVADVATENGITFRQTSQLEEVTT
jgi:aerobic-type carbon monoxide dehydrogenase small subunit (CoxS/CutS family)